MPTNPTHAYKCTSCLHLYLMPKSLPHAYKRNSCLHLYLMLISATHAYKFTSCLQSFLMPTNVPHAYKHTSCLQVYLTMPDGTAVPHYDVRRRTCFLCLLFSRRNLPKQPSGTFDVINGGIHQVNCNEELLVVQCVIWTMVEFVIENVRAWDIRPLRHLTSMYRPFRYLRTLFVLCGRQREGCRHESQKAMLTLTAVRPQFEAGSLRAVFT